jgi:uncharacterized protein YndB with AHSA1/START domain
VADDDPLIKEIFIDASPEDIFPYLTESDKYVRWMGVTAKLEARPGGMFRVDPNGRDVIFGEFVEVTPPTRVVFTWGWKEPGHPVPAGSTIVAIDLIRQGSGTLLRLEHRNLPAESKDKHELGWSHYLGRLRSLIAGADPGPDPMADPAIKHG